MYKAMYKVDKAQITKLLIDLVNIESPYFEEDKIIEFIYRWFKQNNIDSFIHEYHEAKVTGFKGKNIVVNLEGNKCGPVICLNGHLDTVK
ncbi:MAG: M20 family peptidase, partial [Tissierellia bacterium]|nr:M20 family peptidase [Tissierellia bacterium]